MYNFPYRPDRLNDILKYNNRSNKYTLYHSIDNTGKNIITPYSYMKSYEIGVVGKKMNGEMNMTHFFDIVSGKRRINFKKELSTEMFIEFIEYYYRIIPIKLRKKIFSSI